MTQCFLELLLKSGHFLLQLIGQSKSYRTPIIFHQLRIRKIIFKFAFTHWFPKAFFFYYIWLNIKYSHRKGNIFLIIIQFNIIIYHNPKLINHLLHIRHGTKALYIKYFHHKELEAPRGQVIYQVMQLVNSRA